MSVIVIPNVSEGRSSETILALEKSLTGAGGRVLDTHSDARHHRTVFTVAGEPPQAIAAAVALAEASSRLIDLRHHHGVHPRLGALDVCPFVPLDDDVRRIVPLAEEAAKRIAEEVGLPVFLYGAAARSDARRELPLLRRGGLGALIDRIAKGDRPDMGPADIDERVGVVCVGARGPLIALNVWLRADVSHARTLARAVRTSNGGLPAVRALGMDMGPGFSQVSMNLTDPFTTGIEEVVEVIGVDADARGVEVVRVEMVGLVPERFLPAAHTRATRLLDQPGRSLESELSRR